MHSLINNFFHQILEDLDKFFVNIIDMDLVRMNTKKYNFKNLNQAFAFVKKVSFLPFEKGTSCNIFTIFK